MHPQFSELIKEAIQLELNAGRLYLLFYNHFPEDAEFWWTLTIEEENHAALLKTVELMNASSVAIPDGIIHDGLSDLRASNQFILQALEDFEKKPDRAEAFQLALQIESSAGEAHYDHFMKNAPDSRITKLFRKLNGDDINHANRIREYMSNNQIAG